MKCFGIYSRYGQASIHRSDWTVLQALEDFGSGFTHRIISLIGVDRRQAPAATVIADVPMLFQPCKQGVVALGVPHIYMLCLRLLTSL